MVTAVINLDFVPLLFFFFLYSALEIFISRTMEDYRFRLIEIEDDFEDEELEDDEFEEEDEDEDDYDDRERDEHLLPERIIFPIDLDTFSTGELEDDDDFDDYDDEEDENDYEEEEELMPVVRMLHMDPIEDDDYEDEDEDGEDYGEEDDGEDDYEEEEVEELFPVVMTSPRVSSSIFRGGTLQGGTVINNGVLENSNDSESCEGKPGNQENCGGEIHGSICPICFEAWTSGGEHQICCLPCGHIYGLSCIKKWLQQSRSSGKCPQCNNICTFKDVRVLYASRLCAADEELHKRVRSLEARCAYLEQKAGPLSPDELIDQICSNPAAMQRLATVLTELYQPPVSP
ncbi:hypothetical protein L1987_81534 [Smallanthus sonchifolius]|uniref:Uncharacterized protein n=1 Tax=Smallanthus sonchifolius TaxID=185202 RepID=A0ACB8YQW0_9ASTR|nr:hypothetical protein L1987_81534 [Smallanthus sonchifolius]